MKKLSLLLLAVTAFIGANAQGGGFQRRTIEERVAAVHAKLDSAFKLEASVATQVDAVFTDYYKATDKIREDMMASGERPSREAMQEKMHAPTEARDEKLKKILTEKQYETWKKEIEPGMRPQRPGGGGN